MFLLWQMRSRLAFCSSGMWVRRRLRVTKALMMRRISAKVGQGYSCCSCTYLHLGIASATAFMPVRSDIHSFLLLSQLASSLLALMSSDDNALMAGMDGAVWTVQ